MTIHAARRHGKSVVTGFFRPILAGILLFNLLVIGATVLSLYQSRIEHEQRAAVVSRNLARVLDDYIDSVVGRVDLVLQTTVDEVSRQYAKGGIDAAQMNDFIARQYAHQASLVESVRMTDAQGIVRYGTGVDPAQKVSFASFDFFARLRDDPRAGLVFSRPLIGPISGTWIVVLARRIETPDGAFGGIVYAPITVEHFRTIFSELDLGRRGTVSLCDTVPRIILRFPEPDGMDSVTGNRVTSNEFVSDLREGMTSGTYSARSDIDGVERVYTFRRIADQPLAVVVGLAPEDFLGMWRGELVERIVYCVIFALITLLWAWLFHRVWIRKALAEQLEQQVRERTAQLRDLAIELTRVEERERQEISQELHDDLGQLLAIAKLKLSTLESLDRPVTTEDLQRQVREVEGMIDSANRVARSLSMQLSPPILQQFGLVQALEWLADQMHENYGMRVSVHDDGQPKPLDRIAGSMLFRAVRELLINVHKHAGCNAADVSMAVDGGRLVISVSDTGAGFDPLLTVTPTTRGGFGLFSLNERIRHFGGEMQVDSRPGDGTVVVLTLPLAARMKEGGQ